LKITLINLVVIHGDARYVAFPNGITTAVLLMRHCTHFDLYVKKLQAVGCRTLITNARWRSGVEVIDLHAEPHCLIMNLSWDGIPACVDRQVLSQEQSKAFDERYFQYDVVEVIVVQFAIF
jgi:hypothetical protein